MSVGIALLLKLWHNTAMLNTESTCTPSIIPFPDVQVQS